MYKSIEAVVLKNSLLMPLDRHLTLIRVGSFRAGRHGDYDAQTSHVHRAISLSSSAQSRRDYS